MTTSELNNIKNQYAQEDLQLAIDSGIMCITDTKFGLMTVEVTVSDEFKFYAGNSTNPFFNTKDEKLALKMIADSYTVAE